MAERVWQLRALSVPEILSETFRLYRRHFLKLVAITLLVRAWLGPLLGILLSNLGRLTPNFYLPEALGEPVLLWGVPGGLIYLAVHSLLVAALTSAISDGCLGRLISVKGAYRLALRRVPTLLGVFLFTTPASILALGIGHGLFSIATSFLRELFWGHYYYWGWPSSLADFLFVVLGLLPYLWFNSRFALTVPAIVLEALPPRAALARSWRLTGDSKMRALVVYAVLAFLSLLIALPALILPVILEGLEVPDGVVDVVAILSPALLSALVMPIRVGGLALLYYDLRFRREGLDLALQAGALSQGGIRPPSTPAPHDTSE